MAPNTTLRALRPHSTTCLGSPTGDQQDRKGGNSSRSVSSWASTTLRRGNCLMRLRIRIFFPPQLRVGVEPVAGPLPGVSQLLDLPPQGVLRDQDVVVTCQMPPEQGHGPGGVRVTE